VNEGDTLSCPGELVEAFVVPVDASREEKTTLLHQLGTVHEVAPGDYFPAISGPVFVVSFGAATKEAGE
jgi:hypothetical protein